MQTDTAPSPTTRKPKRNRTVVHLVPESEEARVEAGLPGAALCGRVLTPKNSDTCSWSSPSTEGIHCPKCFELSINA